MSYSTYKNLAQREFDNRLYNRSNWRKDEHMGLDSYSCRMPQLLTPDNQEQLKRALWTAGINDYSLELVESGGFKVHINPEDYQGYLLMEIDSRDRERVRA